MISLSFISLAGCSQHTTDVPANDPNSPVISPKHTTDRPGYMQKIMDNFLENDWSPTLSKDKEIQKKYMKKRDNMEEGSEELYEEDKKRAFTLQEYLDKATAYSEARPSDYNSSNSKKLNKMPVIGE